MSERLVSYLPTREVVHLETVFVYPPIPTRTCDWTAYDGNTLDADFDYDRGCYVSTKPVGWGATEAEAIQDFFDQLEAWA